MTIEELQDKKYQLQESLNQFEIQLKQFGKRLTDAMLEVNAAHQKLGI